MRGVRNLNWSKRRLSSPVVMGLSGNSPHSGDASSSSSNQSDVNTGP